LIFLFLPFSDLKNNDSMQMMNSMNQKNSLFIGDLAIFCTEDDLREAFSCYGDVLEVKIMKSEETSRNLSYGFVKFSNANDAQNAMENLHGVLLCGRPMR
jgi:heterogeneous nuclear ribonucleoprotein A1/A3